MRRQRHDAAAGTAVGHLAKTCRVMEPCEITCGVCLDPRTSIIYHKNVMRPGGCSLAKCKLWLSEAAPGVITHRDSQRLQGHVASLVSNAEAERELQYASIGAEHLAPVWTPSIQAQILGICFPEKQNRA